MRIASIALLALAAGVFAAPVDVQFELDILKKSEFNSNTFFADFTVYTSSSGACNADDATEQLYVKNTVGGVTALTPVDTTTVLASNDPLCDPANTDDFCPQNYDWVPNKVANVVHCVVEWSGRFELEAVVDYHNFPFDYQDWHVQFTGDEGSGAVYSIADQTFPEHYFHIDGWRDVSVSAFTGTATNAITSAVAPTFTYVKTVRREFTFFLSKYVSNIVLLVIMSAFTAFLPVNDSVRILLALLSFIAIILWQFVIADKLPSAAYPNKYDDFTHISFAFIFAQFLYYTVHKAVYKEDNVDVKTLGEDAADVPAAMSSAKKIDIVVTAIYSLVYFIAVASVLGVATNLDH